MSATPPFNFDERRDRRSTWSSKWNKYAPDVLPFWVADMDMPTAPSILAALHERIGAGALGYTVTPDSIVEAVCEWLREQYHWSVHPDWLVFIPAVVGGFNAACRAVGNAGDSVLVPLPVYHPFLDAPGHSERAPLFVELANDRDRWVMDLPRYAKALTPRTRTLLFCNPQNPTGRVYTRAELQDLAEFCLRHDLVVCSDEIHCPLVLEPGAVHVPIAGMHEDLAARAITLLAPTKAYNIPGVGCGVAVIANPQLRDAFKAASVGLVPSIGPLAYVASEAAWRDRSTWLAELLIYLRGNRDVLAQRMATLQLPTAHVEGTYLAWIDVRSLGLADPGNWFETFGIGLSDGAQFGGAGFVRYNFGCPRSLLAEGLERFAKAVSAARDRLA